MSDNTDVDVTGMSVERQVAFRVALSMYLGERCKYCLGVFDTLESLHDAVWAGYHEHGRLAHERCWKEHNETPV